MNEVMKALLERRTIRQYEDKAVPAELIEQIVEAGLYAPSSMGKQNSKIVVITDKELIHELSVVNNEIGGWAEGNDPFYGAPVVLLVLGYTGLGKQKYDGSVVMENLMLAAHSLGLGSCWVQARMRTAADGMPSGDYVRRVLDAPEGLSLEAMLVVGSICEHPAPHTAADIDMSLVSWESF